MVHGKAAGEKISWGMDQVAGLRRIHSAISAQRSLSPVKEEMGNPRRQKEKGA